MSLLKFITDNKYLIDHIHEYDREDAINILLKWFIDNNSKHQSREHAIERYNELLNRKQTNDKLLISTI